MTLTKETYDALHSEMVEWLDDYGCNLWDIQHSTEGIAFILSEEDFTDSEGGEYSIRRIPLPAKFQKIA